MNKQSTQIHGNSTIHSDQPHDSAHKHVSGEAEYIDDIVEPTGLLHAYLGLSTVANGSIDEIDLSDVRSAKGVVGVLTAADIPGVNDISPTGKKDDPVFATTVDFHGQAMFAVIANSRAEARNAALAAKVKYTEKEPVTDVAEARNSQYPFVTEPLTLKRGDAQSALEKAPRRIQSSMRIGGQDHFYLEGHIALALPGEDDDVTVYSSTQHPSEVQHMVGHVLDVPSNAVTVKVRRMGGAFGGKETQSNLFAAVAALAAKKFNRAVKLRPDRDDDMIVTGKRHDFLVDYDVGFTDEGRITAVNATFAARCGNSADLSGPVTDRALFHADNCYFFPDVVLKSEPFKTNTVSNTAFRGFGGPQGMLGGERMIEEIAYALGRDPLEIRKANFYGDTDRNITPYHQTVTDNIIGQIVEELETSSDYQSRREAILDFNRRKHVVRKGISLTPVKFGISFTATWYNQAGALVHIYTDGSLHLNHGGTEMGQGLNTKVAQVLADEFQVDLDQIKVTATDTGKVPNTSATAASSGSDLNGMAAAAAAKTIKGRLIEFACEKHAVTADQVILKPVRSGLEIRPSRSGISSRPPIWNGSSFLRPDFTRHRAFTGTGKQEADGHSTTMPMGAAVSEVSVDTLTGEYQVDRVDILHDVGRSLNPAIDLGQIEGGFIQGMGWLTTEELWWDNQGRLRTHAPSTYKIPLASDRPRIFNVALADWSENREMTIRRSKAVGEPPFMLAMSVLEALSMAVASENNYDTCPRLDAPATPECVLMALERIRGS